MREIERLATAISVALAIAGAQDGKTRFFLTGG
jgi:hypothetical protein